MFFVSFDNSSSRSTAQPIKKNSATCMIGRSVGVVYNSKSATLQQFSCIQRTRFRWYCWVINTSLKAKETDNLKQTIEGINLLRKLVGNTYLCARYLTVRPFSNRIWNVNLRTRLPYVIVLGQYRTCSNNAFRAIIYASRLIYECRRFFVVIIFRKF